MHPIVLGYAIRIVGLLSPNASMQLLSLFFAIHTSRQQFPLWQLLEFRFSVCLTATHSLTSFWNMLCCFLLCHLHAMWKAIYFAFTSISSNPLELATLAFGTSTMVVTTILARCISDYDSQFCSTSFVCA